MVSRQVSRSFLVVGIVLVAAGTACVPVGRSSAPTELPLEPQFEPATSTPPSSESDSPTPMQTASTSSVVPSPSPTSTPTGTVGTEPPVTPTPTATERGFFASATVLDDPSDRTATLERSPSWADLERITLERDGEVMTLAILLAGGAPQTAPDDQHTMNIATFFDVDGDGFLDYEIWANVSSTGWGTAYYDNVEGRALFADEDGIEVAVVDGQVVMTFDASLLGDAERFRFATSSEYGRYETIGTSLMARDDAPDNDQPAHFPG